MKRFFLSAGVAALSLALVAVAQSRADGRSGGSSHQSKGPSHTGSRHDDHHRSPVHFDHKFHERWSHNFRANSRFGFGKYGYRSLYYSHYRWSNDYRCYLYWAPYCRCWFFYEPTYSYYVPVSYYREVYPEAAPAVATAVTPTTPVVQQQTTVVVTPPSTVAPPPDAPPPGPIPPLAPAPTNVQKTTVAPTAP